MSVVRLVEKSNKETIETLEWMLQEAKRGNLNDLVSSFRHRKEGAQIALTGAYKDSSKALMAVMRMSTVLMRAHDSVYGSPDPR